MEDEPGVIMVRGRVKSDLERFQQLLVTLSHEAPEILEWETRDYRYRCLVDRYVWADALSHLAHEVRYSNFKARVAEVQGSARELVYSKLWLITRTLTDLDDEQ